MKFNRWIICSASFLVQFLIFGIQNSYGILFIPLKTEFKSSQVETAWIGTFSFTLMYMLGPVVTRSCARFGFRFMTGAGSIITLAGLFCSSYVNDIRLLYITYTVPLGVGTSMCFYSSLGILNIHFKDRLSLAYGFAMSGAGFGIPVISKLSSIIITTAGWRRYIQVISASGIILFFCGLTYFKELDEKPNGKITKVAIIAQQKNSVHWLKRLVRNMAQFGKMLFDYKIFANNKALSVWTLALTLILVGYLVPFIYLIRIADDIGVPRSQSTLLIGYLAISQAVSKIILGQIGDMKASSRFGILQIFALINAINTTLCPLAFNYAFLVVYVIVFGICDGCFGVMFSMGIHYIVGDKDMSRAFSSVSSAISIVQTVTTPLVGLVYDIFGKYNIAFFISGGLSTLGACAAFLVPILLIEQKNTQSKLSPAAKLKIEELHLDVSSTKKEAERRVVGIPLTACSAIIKPEHTSQCAYCSDFISMSGCPRNCIENGDHSVNWV